MNRSFVRTAALVLVACTTLITGGVCIPPTPEPPTPVGSLTDAQRVRSFSPTELSQEIQDAAEDRMPLSDCLGGGTPPLDATSSNNPLAMLWELIQRYQGKSVPVYHTEQHKITYTMSGYSDVLTGLLVVPYGPNYYDDELSVPIVALQHPTQVKRSQSPSNAANVPIDDELTIPVAGAIAHLGYIVVVADYPGLGDNYNVHPYCMTELGRVVVGAMDASLQKIDQLRQIPKPRNIGVSWDGRVFLMGYSEGGYATLVTAKEIQTRHADRYPLAGVAALDGPHSLSDTMRNVMINADTSYTAPYFLPYVVAAYGAAYGSSVDILNFDKAVVSTIHRQETGWDAFNSALYRLVVSQKGDPDVTGTIISNKMMEVDFYGGPSSILTSGFLTTLKEDTGTLVTTLKNNDAFRNWVPDSSYRVILYHNSLDDYVPVGNSYNAFVEWQDYSNVDFQPFVDYIPYLGSVHAGALIPAYIKGIQWMDAIAYPARYK